MSEHTDKADKPDEGVVTGARPTDGGQWVPYSRLEKVIGQRKELEAQLSDLQGKLKPVDELQNQLTEAQSRLATLESELGQAQDFRALASKGFTDDSIAGAFRSAWSGLPKTDRPGLGDWVDQLKEDPSKAPALLRPHLATETSSQKSAPEKSTPKGTGSGSQPPGAPASYTPEELRRIRDAAVASGDWSKWIAATKAMGYSS